MQTNRIWQLQSRKMDGEASMAELRELEQLLMNLPEDAYKIDIVSSYHQKKSNADQFGDEEALALETHMERMQELYPEDFQDGSSTIGSDRPSVRTYLRWPKLALLAGLPLLIFATYWVLSPKKAGSPSPTSNPVQLADQTKPPNSTTTKRILPDGTQVWLNGNSHVSYEEDFGKNNRREVVLIGEAFFDVTHNEHLPFIVHAKSINITVKGTAFNVKAYPEDKNVETSLLRGIVEVSAKADPKRKFVLKPSEKINISVSADNELQPSATGRKSIPRSPSDNNIYSIDKLQPEPRSNIIPEVAWLQNKLMFNSEPLSEIVKKMQRWYGTTIEVKDDRLKDLRFTGAFSNETLHQALNALQSTYPFEISIENNVVVLYMKQ